MDCSMPASLSFIVFRSLLKLLSIESVMPSNHLTPASLFSSCPQSFQHLSLFQWISYSHQVAKVLELQHSSFPWVQFSSVTQSCPTLCVPMNHSTPGLPVHHQLRESAQTHVHWVVDGIQPSHPLSSPSSPVETVLQSHINFYILYLIFFSLVWITEDSYALY